MSDIYDQMGVRKVINARATSTYLGSSLMLEDVLAAMQDAAKHFVNEHELFEKASQRVASLCRAEAALITSGAAAGCSVAAAACMTGTDRAKIRRLPDTTGMKNEVIIYRAQRNPYDQAFTQTGAIFVEIGECRRVWPWDLKSAISDNTAAIAHYPGYPSTAVPPLEEIIKVAKEAGIPVIVDAAAELPPASNLWKFTEMGAALVVFSGGKAIHGPSCSGFILGRKGLIEACTLNFSPHYSIGRSMKTGKEEVVGLVKALELFLEKDFEEEAQAWEHQVDYLVKSLSKISHIKVGRVYPNPLMHHIRPSWPIPRVRVEVDEEELGMSYEDVCDSLENGEPSIVTDKEPSMVTEKQPGAILINPQCLVPGQEEIVARRLKEILTAV